MGGQGFKLQIQPTFRVLKQLRRWYCLPYNMGKWLNILAGREIAPNTGANVTKFFTLAAKSWKLVGKLVTRMFHHNLT